MPGRKVSPLKAVPAGGKAPAQTVRAAAEGGSKRELLVAVRVRIAGAIDEPGTAPRDVAALVMRLLAITKDIEAMDARSDEGRGQADQPAGDGPDPVDESFDASSI